MSSLEFYDFSGVEEDDLDVDGDEVLYDESDDEDTSSREQNYTVLSEEDIKKLQEEIITEISTTLSISLDAAKILLQHHNWSNTNLHDAWFADEAEVRTKVGLLEKEKPLTPPAKKKTKLTCSICFENMCESTMYDAGCGHCFCNDCWKSYITTSIEDGPGCLTLRCPHPSCGAAVVHSMIDALVDKESEKKYSRYLLRSYIEAGKRTKWCPAPGCDYAVDMVVGSGSYDVFCNCKYSFCWNCTQESHRPVDCETVASWISKNSAESENTTWMIVNSKPCPKCKRPIEKNNGCMHMSCTSPCNFQFCWLCLGPWSEHGNQTGGFYACNSYEVERKKGTYDDIERERAMAKYTLERYTHYYERWAANDKSRANAIAKFQQVEAESITKLGILQDEIKSQLKFITEAWLQIIECRRVLKWTYAYGFYLPQHEQVKRQLFEYLQGEAESGLERLHHCVEEDLEVYLKAKAPAEKFNEFRKKLAELTSVTRKFFDNLVRALENGLADVDSCSCSKNMEGAQAAPSEMEMWLCERCTYYNTKSDIICQMCYERPGAWSCKHCTYSNASSATKCLLCDRSHQ